MTTQEKPTVIMYHKGCPDGFGAAWAAWRSRLNATYHAVSHKAPLPETPAVSRIYLLDFAPSRPETEELHARHGPENVRIVDHHVSAERELDGLPNCRFDSSRSGAVLAWDEFCSNYRMPELLEYVQDRDLWQWALPHSREINAYLFTLGWNFQRWNQVHRELRDRAERRRIIETGALLVREKDQTVSYLASIAATTTIAGHRVPSVNSPTHRSEIGHLLLQLHPDAPFAAVWYDAADQQRHWSLRSRGDFDVTGIATAMGGGGHPAAAGFSAQRPEIADPCLG